MLGKDKGHARAPRGLHGANRPTSRASRAPNQGPRNQSRASDPARPMTSPPEVTPAMTTFLRQFSTATTSNEAFSASNSTTLPPTRQMWGVAPAVPPLPLPSRLSSLSMGSATFPMYAEHADGPSGGSSGGGRTRHTGTDLWSDLNGAPLRAHGEVGESKNFVATRYMGSSQPPPVYNSLRSTSYAHASQPLGSAPSTAEPFQSLQWCDSPRSADVNRGHIQPSSGMPNMRSSPLDMPVAAAHSGDTRGGLVSPFDSLPPPQTSGQPGGATSAAVDVPSLKLQAVINDFLYQRFLALGGTEQASQCIEPQRQLLQELMFHNFFREEAHRLAQLSQPAAINAPPTVPTGNDSLSTPALSDKDSSAALVSSRLTADQAISLETEQQLTRRYRHERFGKTLQWDLILPFWRNSPPLTVEAVSPDARRRVEQWKWQLLVLDTALSFSAAVLEAPAGSDAHGTTPFVSDPLSRLNGRARECPSLPMTRRTAWDPQRAAAAVPLTASAAAASAILRRQQQAARALDGEGFMACLRQSVLIDQGVRHYRALRAEGAEWRSFVFPLPFLNDTADGVRRALLTEDTGDVLSRVHVDVLASKAQPYGCPAAGLSPPLQSCLAAGSGADAGLPTSPLCNSLGTSRTANTAPNLGESLSMLFNGSVVLSGTMEEPAAEAGVGVPDGGAMDRRHDVPSTEFLSWAQWASSLRHPLLANPLRALTTEDVTGTCHVVCGRPSPPPSEAALHWLRHRHPLRQMPLLFPAHPLISQPEDPVDGSEDDYTLCSLAPLNKNKDDACTDAQEANDSTFAFHAGTLMRRQNGVSEGNADRRREDDSWEATTAPTSTRSSAISTCDGDDDEDSAGSCDGHLAVSEGARDAYRFGLMMEEWKSKRAGVVRRMDCEDPPWRMIGPRFGAEPRPLALHITEAQLPWMATQLSPDRDGLLDLQELHVAFGYETVFRREMMHAWLWVKSVLMTRRNLLIVRLHFAPEPGAPGTCLDTDDEETTSLPGDGLGGPTGSVVVAGIALPARTVARVSARVSARSLSSTSSTAATVGAIGGSAGFHPHSSVPPPLPSAGEFSVRPAPRSAPSLPITREDDELPSISQRASPVLTPQQGQRCAHEDAAMERLAPRLSPSSSDLAAANGVDAVTSASKAISVTPRPTPAPLASPLPRPVLHQPQPQRTSLFHDACAAQQHGAVVNGVGHQSTQPPKHPHTATGAPPPPMSPPMTELPAPSVATSADVLARLAQRPVVGVCSTVPQPEDDPAVLREVMLRGLEFVPSLQILHIQNGPMEVLRSLFRETRQQHHHYYYGNMATSRYASLLPPPPKPGLNPELVSPLREIYFSTEQHPRARREAALLEITAHRFPQLEVLWIDSPRIHHIFFTPLMPTTSLTVPTVPTMPLRELHLLLDASFSSSNLSGIETVPTLEVVHLGRIIVNTLGFLGESQSLRELLLHACRFIPCTVGDDDNAAPHPLLGVERAPALETLSLAYTNDAKTVDNFARCRTLRKLILTRCNGISSASLAGLEHLPLLAELCLEFTRVNNLSMFAKSASLRVLRLCGCKRVLRMSILDLERSPTLTELYLNDTNVVTVANLGCGSSSIKVLDLSGCRHLDDSGMQGLQGLPCLEILNLSHTPVMRVEFLRDCPKLASLYLEGCPRLAADGLRGLERLPRLQRLIATGCTTVETVSFLGASASLTALSVVGCQSLVTEGLVGIERCASLRYLNLADTAISSVGFLVAGARHLQYLNLSGCANLTSRGLRGLESLPALADLFLQRLSTKVNDISFLVTSRSLRRISLRDSIGVSVYTRRELARGKGIVIEH